MAPASGWEQWVGRAEASPAQQHDPPHRPAGGTLNAGDQFRLSRQSAAAVIVGLQCVAGFLLLGLPSAVSLGVLAGILELVPAIGPLTALIIAASHAEHALAVVLFLAIVRLVQDYVIYPRLVRHGMHLSTWAVILTVWAGAALAQAPGVMLAIPIAGFVSVSIRHWREYREIERLVGRAAAAGD